MQLQTYLIFVQQVIVPYLINVNLPKIVDPFPYQETVSQTRKFYSDIYQLP